MKMCIKLIPCDDQADVESEDKSDWNLVAIVATIQANTLKCLLC